MSQFVSYDPSSKARRRIPDHEWEKHRETLQALHEGNEYKDIVKIMKKEHGFHARYISHLPGLDLDADTQQSQAIQTEVFGMGTSQVYSKKGHEGHSKKGE